jgi:hypothetical protein
MAHVFLRQLHAVSDSTIHIGADGDGRLLRVVDQIRHHIRKELAEGFRRVHVGLGRESGALDDAGHRFGGLGTLRDPGIHTIKLHGRSFESLLRIVGAENLKETTFLGEALVSRNDTENGAVLGTFFTETDNYGHDDGTGMWVRFWGRAWWRL